MDNEKQILDELSERISQLPENNQRELLSSLTSQLPRGSFFLTQKQAREKFKDNYSPEDNSPKKEYIKQHLHKAAYNYILSHGGTQDEAWKYTAEIFKDNVERLNTAKKETHARWHMKGVVQSYKDHPKQKSMVKRGIITHADLSNRRTPHMQLERLVKAVKLHNWVSGIEAKVKDQEGRMRLLEAQTEASDRQLEEVQSYLGMAGLPKEEKIAIYKKKGLTQKQVAEILDVSIRTVQRGWN